MTKEPTQGVVVINIEVINLRGYLVSLILTECPVLQIKLKLINDNCLPRRFSS